MCRIVNRIISSILLIFLIHIIALSEEVSPNISWQSQNTNIPVSIDATVDYSNFQTISQYHAKLQTWKKESIDIFSRFGLLESENSPEKIDLEEGFALLFDKETYESMVFSEDANATWRYMNGRAEVCYVNSLNGLYVQHNYNASKTSEHIVHNTELNSVIEEGIKKLAELGIEVGSPLQMTAYYPYQENKTNYEQDQPHFIEIAFVRLLNGIKMMPWMQRTAFDTFTPKSFITMYIDEQGISNVLAPLVFESLISSSDKKLLNLNQAIEALNVHLESLLFPKNSKKIIIDHISLEYIPFPVTVECKELQIIPVWSFYSNYQDDDKRQVICLNAHTGDPVL